MSDHARLVTQVAKLARTMLEPVELAHHDPARAPRRVDLAVRHMSEWAESPVARLVAENPDLVHDGGDLAVSSVAAEDRREDVMVARMALHALDDFASALAAWVRQGQLLLDDVRRFTVPVDASKLPKDAGQFCGNCRKAGYPWSPVFAARPARGLCEWCYRRCGAVADDDAPPPVEVVKLHLAGRGREAARLLADLRRKHEKQVHV